MFEALRPSSFLPPYYYQLFRYLLSKDNGSICNKSCKRIYILLAADYGNFGDIAITKAQNDILFELFPEYTLELIPTYLCYEGMKSLKKHISKDDIITIVGGGNCSDLYYSYEIYRQLICTIFHNKIISFPQSIIFADLNNLKSACKKYSGRKKLLFLTREKNSYKISKKYILATEVNLLPDVVLTLDKFEKLSDRKGIITCLRNDKERLLSDEQRNMIYGAIASSGQEVTIVDTYREEYNIDTDSAERMLDLFINNLKSKRLLITDRLHGMIFGYITGTPTIVLSNSNPKIQESYEWISECNYIRYLKNCDNIDSEILDMLTVVPCYEFFSKKHMEFRGMYKHVLTKFIK